MGDPAACQGIEVGFVNGRDASEPFLADDPRMGTTLTADQIRFNVRFEFGAATVNWQPFVGYMT